MRAAVIHRYGAPEVLHLAQVDRRTIQPDHLLVKVHASSVNPIDWKIRQGMLQLLTGYTFPMILRFDVAGEVVAVGERVTQFQVGDAIMSGSINSVAEPTPSMLLFLRKLPRLKPPT